jgi:predicted dehydrogenase
VLNPAHGTDPVKAVLSLTNQLGADGVIITASAKTDDVIAQAARMSRKQGRIVLVGVVGLDLKRADFYGKELSFRVSCSYGPGRYDEAYEQQGHDYPVGYVRWTANRNFHAVLHAMERGQLDVRTFITEVVPFADFAKIYSQIAQPRSGGPVIASLMQYPDVVNLSPKLTLRESRYAAGSGTVGIIGAGNFTEAILLPALTAAGANLKTIASAGGLTATLLAGKFGIEQSTTDYQHILNDPAIDLCVITTRHDSHARLTIEALRAGKHVLVEKPLAIYEAELSGIITAQQQSGGTVMVGFNRRFSPYAQKMKSLLGGLRSADVPMNVVATINAGFISGDSWVHDRASGGGRIVGEVGHFVDFISFLTGSPVVSVCLNAMGQRPSETSDSASLLLRYQNGATGVINYFSNGSKAYDKERVEVYSQERTLVLANFRTLTGYGFRGFSSLSGRQNKGHAEQMKRLVKQIREGGEPLIPFADLINTTQTTLAALQSLRENCWVDVASIGLTSVPTVLTQEP